MSARLDKVTEMRGDQHMEKKIPLRRGVVIASSIVLFSAFILPAAAATITRTINAQFGINITINDLPFAPKDAKGNPVEAMVVDGTTYLPVRALGEATGTTVHWDGTTNTVQLFTSGNGEWTPVDRTFMNMMAGKVGSGDDKITYFQFDYLTDTEALYANSAQDYKTGFKYNGESIGSLTRAYINIETNKQYNAIQFQISAIYNNTKIVPVIVEVRDAVTDIVYDTWEVAEGTQLVEADISGAEEIKITFKGDWESNPETRLVTIGDMKLRG